MNKAIVIWDNLTSDDKEYCNRVRDITLFYNYDCPGYKQIITKELHQTLLDLHMQKYEWVYINSMGHWISDKSLYDKLITQCEADGVPLMAHILYRPNTYPNIDDQFLLLNLNTWASVGFPKLEETKTQFNFETVIVERSAENYHDDYTPYWISPGEILEQHESYAKLFGMELIKKLMEAGYTVKNFDQNTRNYKTNLYANYNETELKKFFKDGLSTWEHTPAFADIVTKELDTLNKTIYILNSESLYIPPEPYGPVDHIVGVAAGFKTVLLLNLLTFEDHATVSYIDVSAPSLQYQQFLINMWDGNLDTYGDISKQFQTAHPEYRYAWCSWNGWDNEINTLLSDAKLTRDEFKLLWQRYKQLSHRYYEVDLIKESYKLVDIVKERRASKTYIWISNALDMQWLVFLHGKDKGKLIEDQIKQELKESRLDYCLESSGYFWYA